MTANNSKKNNVVFFFVSVVKIVYYNNYQSSITMPWAKKNILRHYLYGDKVIQNCFNLWMGCIPINIIMIYYWDNELKKKRLYILEADIISIKKDWFDVSCPRMYFFTGCGPYDHH